MLDFTEFKNEFINSCRNELTGVARFSPYGNIEIEERSVRKAQRGELTGLIFREPDTVCAPTYYVEDFYDLYRDGRSLQELSAGLVRNAYSYIHHPPEFPDIGPDIFAGRAAFGVRLLNKAANRDYLKDLPYLDEGCGFALIAEIRYGEFSAVINSGLLEQLGMTKDDLFEKALQDSLLNERATLFALADMLPDYPRGGVNLLDSEAGTILPPLSLYVLSNEEGFWGAAALFYPGMLERLSDLLGGDFYVLPSSVHEVLLLPVTSADPQELADTIRNANRCITEPEAFLADELFIYERGRLRQVSYGGIVPTPGSLPC